VDGSSPLQAPPVDTAGLCAFLERVGAPRRLLLAISGGADSMALMRLAAPLNADGRFQISVATVDHQLRAGARAEADLVARCAKALGLGHAILSWAGAKPSSGLQAAARHARYRLLIDHAGATGAQALLTAHHADDQAETVFMRLHRGSGPRGLAGMAETSLVAAGAGARLALLRPLLGVRRRELRRLMTDAGADFVDDPSNDDVAYQRVRVRRLIDRLERDGALSVAALLDAAAACRSVADRIETVENARFAELGGAFDASGGVWLGAAMLAVDDAPLVARLVRAVGGGDHGPDAAASGGALATALSGRLATLGGTMLARRGDQLMIFREPAGVLGRAGVDPVPPLPLAAGETALWDGRFIIANPFDGPASVRPFGASPDAAALPAEERRRLAAAPAFWRGADYVAFAAETGAATPLAEERFFQRVNRFAEIT